MQQRKAIIFTRADAFIVLPGGFGTLEELTVVLTLRQLGYHDKSSAVVNVGGFYDPLIELFEHFFDQRTAHQRYRVLYRVVDSSAAALNYIHETRSRANAV